MDMKTKIKMLATANGMSLTELAESIGMSKQNFSNKLHRDSFHPGDLEKIAEVCNAEVGFMINGEKFI